MSPSWTKALRPAPAGRGGIAIGRDRVCAAVLSADGRDAPPTILARPLAPGLFDGRPDAAAEDALTAALVDVGARLREQYAALHVALPDSVLRAAVFELDELPRAARLREDLLRWRFAKEWQRDEDSLECRGAALGRDGAAHLLFAQAGDRAWLACVRRALARAGLRPWSLNAAAVYRFNFFHDRIGGAPGALLTLEPDSWSLLLWDEAGRVRQVLTRLRGGQGGAEEAALIADEAERAVVAYVRADGRRRVERLHLAGGQGDTAALAREFDARLRQPALVLRAPPPAGASEDILRDDLAPLALVAALSP